MFLHDCYFFPGPQSMSSSFFIQYQVCLLHMLHLYILVVTLSLSRINCLPTFLITKAKEVKIPSPERSFAIMQEKEFLWSSRTRANPDFAGFFCAIHGAINWLPNLMKTIVWKHREFLAFFSNNQNYEMKLVLKRLYCSGIDRVYIEMEKCLRVNLLKTNKTWPVLLCINSLPWGMSFPP